MDDAAAPPDAFDESPVTLRILTGEDGGDRVASQVEVEGLGHLLIATAGTRTEFRRFNHDRPAGDSQLTFGGRVHVHATGCSGSATPNGLFEVQATATLRGACDLLHVLRELGWLLEGDDAMEARWMEEDSPEPADFAPPAAAPGPAPPVDGGPATPPSADPSAPGGPATT